MFAGSISPTGPYESYIWLAKLDAMGDSGISGAYDHIQLSDGSFIITGITDYDFGEGDFFLMKTDSLGNLLWENTYNGGRSDRGVSVAQTFNGGFIIAGYSASTPAMGVLDAYIVKTDSTGDSPWHVFTGDQVGIWLYLSCKQRIVVSFLQGVNLQLPAIPTSGL